MLCSHPGQFSVLPHNAFSHKRGFSLTMFCNQLSFRLHLLNRLQSGAPLLLQGGVHLRGVRVNGRRNAHNLLDLALTFKLGLVLHELPVSEPDLACALRRRRKHSVHHCGVQCLQMFLLKNFFPYLEQIPDGRVSLRQDILLGRKLCIRVHWVFQGPPSGDSIPAGVMRQLRCELLPLGKCAMRFLARSQQLFAAHRLFLKTNFRDSLDTIGQIEGQSGRSESRRCLGNSLVLHALHLAREQSN